MIINQHTISLFLIEPIPILFTVLHFMSLIDLFVFLLFDGAFKEYYSYIRVTEMFPQIFLSITNPKKNVYHVCKQRKRFFYFVTHLCVFTSGLRECEKRKRKSHISLNSFFSHSYFPNKDPSKPYLPTRCYSLSLQKYTEHYFKAEATKKKFPERKIHKSLYEFLNNKSYMSLHEI